MLKRNTAPRQLPLPFWEEYWRKLFLNPQEAEGASEKKVGEKRNIPPPIIPHMGGRDKRARLPYKDND